jgi:hypothetical protein
MVWRSSRIDSGRTVKRDAIGVGLAAPFAVAVLSGVFGLDDAEEPITQGLDIVFGEAGGQKWPLDVLTPGPRDTPRPAGIFFEGFGRGHPSFYLNARALAGASFVPVRVTSRNIWPRYIDEAQLAVRWICVNAATRGVDHDRVGAYRYSIGGQLAAMLGTRVMRDVTDPVHGEPAIRVTCVVNNAGPDSVPFPLRQAFHLSSCLDAP